MTSGESGEGYEGVSDTEYRAMNNLQRPVIGASKRGQDWIDFSRKVLCHIENYTVPQYGDKGEDQASNWSIEMLIEQTKKYANRYGKNQRQGQEELDFMKGCHYLQMAFTRFQEEQNATR